MFNYDLFILLFKILGLIKELCSDDVFARVYDVVSESYRTVGLTEIDMTSLELSLSSVLSKNQEEGPL